MKRLQLIAGLILFSLIACQKDSISDIQPDSTEIKPSRPPQFGTDYSVENGILKFSSLDSYLNTIQFLNQKTAAEKAQFASNHGFISFYKKFFDNFNEIARLENEAERLRIVDSKYVDMSNGFPNVNIGNASLSTVIDKNGLVYIRETLFRFEDQREIIVKGGEVEAAMNPEDFSIENVTVINTLMTERDNKSSGARIAGTCTAIRGQTGNSVTGCTVGGQVFMEQYPLDYDFIKVRLVFTVQTSADSWKFFGSFKGTPTLNLSYVLNIFDQDQQKIGRLDTYRTVSNTLSYSETTTVDNVYNFLVPFYSIGLEKRFISPLGVSRFTEFIIGNCGVSAECVN